MSNPALIGLSTSLTVRRSTGSYIKGVWTPGVASKFTIEASVQPANSEDLQALPEGARSSSTIKLYTEAFLKTLDTATKAPADEVIWEGVAHKVISVARYTMGTLDHYKVIAVRQQP